MQGHVFVTQELFEFFVHSVRENFVTRLTAPCEQRQRKIRGKYGGGVYDVSAYRREKYGGGFDEDRDPVIPGCGADVDGGRSGDRFVEVFCGTQAEICASYFGFDAARERK